jgi:hypothetical protein
MRMSEHEVAILDLQRAPYAREACCRVVQGIRTTVDCIFVGRFDQNLAVQRISPPPSSPTGCACPYSTTSPFGNQPAQKVNYIFAHTLPRSHIVIV